jgi:hypothetical protein
VLAVGNTALVLHLAQLGSQTWKTMETKLRALVLTHHGCFNRGRLSQSHSKQK